MAGAVKRPQTRTRAMPLDWLIPHSGDDMARLIVIGGGAGGPSAAAKAKRLDPSLEVIILERGRFVSSAA